MKEFVEMLAQEEQMMGRKVEYRNAWETVFNGRDGEERRLRIMIYDVEPLELKAGGETFTMHQSRYVVWDGSGASASGIVEP